MRTPPLLTLVGVLLLTFSRGSTEVTKCPPPESIMPCRCRGRNEQVQVWCSHSDLDRVNGALENLMRLRHIPAIDELIVENNKMRVLPARAFGALRIGRLLLRNNGLEGLSRNAFAGLEDSLEEIYIVEDKLVDFPFDAIEKLVRLEAFTLEKSPIRLLPRFNGLNRLKHIRIEGSQISALPVGAFSSMSNIRQVHITNSKVDRLAEGIFGRLDSLILANFSSNAIGTVERRVFGLLPRLEVLSLSGNKLKDPVPVGRAVEALHSLKSLDLSGNQLNELGEGSFVNLPSLQVLNLRENGISRVQPRSFMHLPALRKVDLSWNRLRNFPINLFDLTPLLEELRMRGNALGTAVEVGELLKSLRSLRFLDLGENGVTELPTGGIRDHSQLQTLDLSGNKITRIQRKAFSNVPSLEELSLRNNSLKEIEPEAWDSLPLKELDLSSNVLQQVHGHTFKGLASLARLDLSQNELKGVAQDAFKLNPNLEYLNLGTNQISALHNEIFNSLSKLQKLDLSRNHLEIVQSGTLRNLRALVLLNFAHNRINTLPGDLFRDLSFLEELNLRSNALSHLPHGLFQGLSALKELNMKGNSIVELSSALFSGLQKLEHLKLSSNQIRHVADNVFNDLLTLRSLDLSSNRISRLPRGSFKNLPQLERFEARDNKITSLDEDVFPNSEALQVFDLAHNLLPSIPRVLESNPLLKVVDLSHNEIQALDPKSFTKLRDLMELYLNDNKITRIPTKTFAGLNSLTILDLDGNEMEEVVEETFTRLPRLIYLRLSRNKVKRVARAAFSDLASLDGLDMFMNEIEEFAPNAFVKTGALKYLNLSHNNLDTVERAGVPSLKSLEVLDLSYNKIHSLTPDAVRHLIWLVEFRVNDNGLCGIPHGTFDGMSRLKMLVLRNNRIRHLPEAVFFKLRNNIAFVDVSGNPLECDCELTWLRNLIAREEVQELSDSECAGPTFLKGTLTKSVRPIQMTCTSSQRNLGPEDCQPLPISKKRSRPINSLTPESSLISNDLFSTDARYNPGPSGFDGPRRVGEKFVESNDFVAGDSPTIYAGSFTKTTQNHPKSSPPSSSLASLFGIPIDFGLNFGISPAFSWSDKGKEGRGKKKAPPPSSLPPSWLGGTKTEQPFTYEAPQYLPSRPPQPYIPLNPLGSKGLEPPLVEPSGSVDVHKAVLPKGKVKFPEGLPKSSWHPNNKHPSPETGFIPIEPFFHQPPANILPTSTTSSKSKNSIPVPDEDEKLYVPVNTKTSTEAGTETRPTKGKEDGLSLSDFWNIFTSTSSSTPPSKPAESVPEQDREKEDEEMSYEEVTAEEEGADSSAHPFNFSAPVDAPLQPVEPDEEEEYNIPFGEPQRPATSTSSSSSSTGRPGIVTKIAEPPMVEARPPPPPPSPPDRAEEEEDEGEEEDETLGPVKTKPPSVPPVIIGDSYKEPRDWYYTNYHNQDQKGNEVLERLLERTNRVQDSLLVQQENSASLRHQAPNLALISTVLTFLYATFCIAL